LILQKITVMHTVENVNIFTDVEDISTVTNHMFLVVPITNDSYTNDENKKNMLEQTKKDEFDKNHKKSWKFQLTQKLSYCSEQPSQKCGMDVKQSS